MTLSIESYEPVPVDLWGKEFETVDATRASQKKGRRLEREFRAFVDAGVEEAKLEEVDGDEDKEEALLEEWMGEAIEKLAAIVDLKLVAAEGSGKASTQIRKQWKAGKLTLGQLERFMDHVRSEEGKANRPS